MIEKPTVIDTGANIIKYFKFAGELHVSGKDGETVIIDLAALSANEETWAQVMDMANDIYSVTCEGPE